MPLPLQITFVTVTVDLSPLFFVTVRTWPTVADPWTRTPHSPDCNFVNVVIFCFLLGLASGEDVWAAIDRRGWLSVTSTAWI